MSKKRIRRVGSIKKELLCKAREAALSAVQIFNNPNILFKSESYIVLMNIAWTYLLHAYYRSQGIDYRYFRQTGKRRKFDKTKRGAFKYWELERCLNDTSSPIDKDTANNLRFLIGLRHEIEHQMTTKIDELLSARFQACCLNFNEYIKKLFDDSYGIDKHLSFSLQFSTIDIEQKEMLSEHPELPANIKSYFIDFDSELSEDEFNSPRYAYRILFIPKTANRKGQADKVIEFVKSDSELAKSVNRDYAIIKETERKKYLPSQIWKTMQEEGYTKFGQYQHTQLWKKLDAKNKSKGLGCLVAETDWRWYEQWMEIVRAHCKENKEKYCE